MIDRLMCRQAERRLAASTKEYNCGIEQGPFTLPEPLNSKARKFALLVGPWNGGGRVVDVMAGRLVLSGFAVQEVKVNQHALSADPDKVARQFKQVSSELAETLDKAKINERFEYSLAIGLSLGSVAMAMTADEHGGFDRFNMAVPGNSLAGSMWRSSRTQHLRLAMESDGVTLEALEDAWSDLAPGNHADAFADKPVQMLISHNDAVIPTAQQHALRHNMWRAGADLEVVYTDVGHYMAVGRACLIGRM